MKVAVFIWILTASLVVIGLGAAHADPSDDVKSCGQVIANMLEANWTEPPAELAKALGVSSDFVRGCVAAYKTGKTASAPARKPTCADVMAELEGAGVQKSADEVAAALHVSVEQVRECAHRSDD
ncbi:MAG: hypothetical protein E4H03_08555 [Myxococcales bacterium]|nr:MAG: hypothetical protein E4H03_08555 [Myxococcales bacterium]